MDARGRHARAREIFLEALDEPADARRPFVQVRAGRDTDLLNDVLSLLSHHVDVPLMALDREASRGAQARRGEPAAVVPIAGGSIAADGGTGRDAGAARVATPVSEMIVAERSGRARGERAARVRTSRRAWTVFALVALVAASVAWTVARRASPGAAQPDVATERR